MVASEESHFADMVLELMNMVWLEVETSRMKVNMDTEIVPFEQTVPWSMWRWTGTRLCWTPSMMFNLKSQVFYSRTLEGKNEIGKIHFKIFIKIHN